MFLTYVTRRGTAVIVFPLIHFLLYVKLLPAKNIIINTTISSQEWQHLDRQAWDTLRCHQTQTLLIIAGFAEVCTTLVRKYETAGIDNLKNAIHIGDAISNSFGNIIALSPKVNTTRPRTKWEGGRNRPVRCRIK